MTHTALARKYRPTRFADLVGQEHVAAGLTGAVAKGRVAHAYLLTGPRGVGKTSAARILAMALNCESPDGTNDGEPCATCDSCRRIWAGSANLDVVEIDAASNRGVDDARDLRERAMYAASAPDRHKVYIIDEAHMLTREAWNALLKILEEPPPQVVFVFATTEPQKITNTAAPVMSRVQRFDFRRIGPLAITKRLQQVAAVESIPFEDDALTLIARVAAGGMRDALSILDQTLAFGEGRVSAARVRDALGLIDDEMYGELLSLIAERRTAEVFPFVAKVLEAGADLAEFVNGAGELLRALLMRVLGGEPEGLTDALRAAVNRHANDFRPGDALRMLKLLAAAESAIRRSPNARLHVESLLAQWTMLDRTVELQDVLHAVQGGVPTAGRSGQGPNSAPAAPSAGSNPRPSAKGPSSIGRIREAWPAVLEAVGTRRRLVREALGNARPVSVSDGEVVIEVPDSEVHLDGLERSRALVTEALVGVMGDESLRVIYCPTTAPVSREPLDPPSGKRMSAESDRTDRLQRYRARDPALDAMAEALDLELLD